MKIIALGDTHGRSLWKYIVNTQKFDKLIFIGDYWDSSDITFEEQAKNFLDICQYKRDNPDKVILLIGNHDYHYLPMCIDMYERYSGFQGYKAFFITGLIVGNKSLFQAAYLYEDWLFTHAGLTYAWLRVSLGLEQHAKIDIQVPIDEYINDVMKFTPVMFAFTGMDPYGDSVESSPIWVRPRSLMKNAYKYETLKQVVGHTHQDKIIVNKDMFFFIDTLGSSHEYLVIEDGQYRVEKTL